MLNLLSSEIFRMRKRAQSWMLFVIALALTALVYGGFVIAAKVNTGPDAADMRRTTTFAGYSDFGVSIAIGFFASVMFVIVASGTMGNEFGWNTLRPLVARARSRVGLLTAKLLSVTLYAVVFTLALALAVAVLVFIGSWIVNEPSGFSMGVLANGLVDALGMLFANAPYMALAFMLATVFRSNAAGIAGTLGVMFIEQPVFSLLGLASDVFASIEKWGIVYNVGEVANIALGNPGNTTRSTLIVLGYSVAFIAVAYAVFMRRDVTSG